MTANPQATGGLARYEEMRDFTRTPEPPPDVNPRTGPLTFTIQKHAARRLHYDLRLEVDGVLVSWPIPKGPSYDPAERRLAIQTEDHPYAYGTFEGTIPAGEYGAGEVIVWDAGTYTTGVCGAFCAVGSPGYRSRRCSRGAARDFVLLPFLPVALCRSPQGGRRAGQLVGIPASPRISLELNNDVAATPRMAWRADCHYLAVARSSNEAQPRLTVLDNAGAVLLDVAAGAERAATSRGPARVNRAAYGAANGGNQHVQVEWLGQQQHYAQSGALRSEWRNLFAASSQDHWHVYAGGHLSESLDEAPAVNQGHVQVNDHE